jgi:hypothetical protein
MFCAPGLVFGGTQGVGSLFHVLRSRTHFRRFRGCRVPFSCFASPYLFLEVPRASGLVFMLCAPGLIIGGTVVVGSRFHVLRAQTHFRRCRGRRVPFYFFELPDSFSAEPGASAPVFMFCTPEFIFGGTDGVGYRFQVFAPGHVFGDAEGVRSRFHVLRVQTPLRWYRGRRVPF